jgi:hypothetical protein
MTALDSRSRAQQRGVNIRSRGPHPPDAASPLTFAHLSGKILSLNGWSVPAAVII